MRDRPIRMRHQVNHNRHGRRILIAGNYSARRRRRVSPGRSKAAPMCIVRLIRRLPARESRCVSAHQRRRPAVRCRSRRRTGQGRRTADFAHVGDAPGGLCGRRLSQRPSLRRAH
jgi:hypothetical protein